MCNELAAQHDEGIPVATGFVGLEGPIPLAGELDDNGGEGESLLALVGIAGI